MELWLLGLAFSGYCLEVNFLSCLLSKYDVTYYVITILRNGILQIELHIIVWNNADVYIFLHVQGLQL